MASNQRSREQVAKDAGSDFREQMFRVTQSKIRNMPVGRAMNSARRIVKVRSPKSNRMLSPSELQKEMNSLM